MSSTTRLTGPPQIHSTPPPPATTDDGWTPATLMGFTENNSLTYLSTGNPCVDFFFHVVPNTPSDDLIMRLALAWDYDKLTTLKLICNLRGVRGTGKCDKENFYTAAFWLHKNHPKTLAGNVGVFARFGYFKDLLEILYRLLEGSYVRSKAKKDLQTRRHCVRNFTMSRLYYHGRDRISYFLYRGRGSGRGRRMQQNRRVTRQKVRTFEGTRALVPREERIKANVEKLNEEKNRARVLRKERDFTKAKKAVERYNRDPDYRLLHEQISRFFAELLKLDIEYLKSNDVNKISLAAKWCPKINSSYDKATLIYESIARKVFPREDYVEYEGIEQSHYVFRVRDRLRKEVLVPLRKVLKLPEVYMSANQWEILPYNRVASVAMKKYKKIFSEHDGDRFKEYLEDVKNGKSTIAAGALLPHEIIASLKDGNNGEVAELQWRRMVEDVSNFGKLKNCIAVCDVSGSMNGTPMEVCVALGLLISEISEEPWKGNVITFSENPQLHKVVGDSLLEKTRFLRNMDWGMNTDFQRVFDRILEVAVARDLRNDDMIKRVFVFSDMEFDQASGYGYSYYYRPRTSRNGWETDYKVIERKYRGKGYRVPEIVFWNLRHSSATPVTEQQRGVALVSGFSKNMVTVFLDGFDVQSLRPVDVMKKAISGELYQKLKVLD
ncbi:hypothetical protein LguiA_030718 [Lonicera macranthoides]